MEASRSEAQAPLVSVIIGTYNAAGCLATALESACAQSLSAIEILVVDDGSTDATAVLVEGFAARDSRVVLLRDERNRGPSAARNRAIAVAKGRWLTPLDADDRFAPDRLSILVERAEAAGADLLIDNLMVHDQATGTSRPAFPHWPADPFGPMDARDFSLRDRPSTDIMGLGYAKPLLGRDFLQRHGLLYAEEIRVGEDFDLYMRCLLKGARLFFVNAPLYHYTRSPKSLSKADSAANYRDFANVNQRLLVEARSQGNEPLVRALADRQRHLDGHLPFMALRDALQGRDVRQALQALRRLPSYGYALSRLTSAGGRRLRRLMGAAGTGGQASSSRL